jgi:hypothetical protein
LSRITDVDEQYDFEVKVRQIKTVRLPTLGAFGSFLAIKPTSYNELPIFNQSAEKYFRGICDGAPGRVVDQVLVKFGGFVNGGLIDEGKANLLLVWTTRKHASGTNEKFRGPVHVRRICNELSLQIGEMLRTGPELWLSLTKDVALEVTEQYFRESTHKPLGN